MKAVRSLQGTRRRQIMPLSRRILRRLIRLKGLSPAQNRNVLVKVLGTQLCCRVGELKRLQICDFLLNFDEVFDRRLRGSAAFRIRKSKQDQLRRRLYPRELPSSELCTIRRFRAILQARGVRVTVSVSAECTKVAHPAARCRHCPALFASARRVEGVRQRMSSTVEATDLGLSQNVPQADRNRLACGLRDLHAQGIVNREDTRQALDALFRHSAMGGGSRK